MAAIPICPETSPFHVSIVPGPSTLVLLGAGAISLLAFAWRRRRAVKAVIPRPFSARTPVRLSLALGLIALMGGRVLAAAGPTSTLYVMNYGEFGGGTVVGLDLFQGLSESSFPTGNSARHLHRRGGRGRADDGVYQHLQGQPVQSHRRPSVGRTLFEFDRKLSTSRRHIRRAVQLQRELFDGRRA